MERQIGNEDHDWLAAIAWDGNGLVPAIAQDREGRVLMVAWMNREALQQTVAKKEAHYWSRSRQRLWKKGESSGHIQHVVEIRMDCDNDVLLLTVQQTGDIACHTGRTSCFFQVLSSDLRWLPVEPVVKSPDEIYR